MADRYSSAVEETRENGPPVFTFIEEAVNAEKTRAQSPLLRRSAACAMKNGLVI